MVYLAEHTTLPDFVFCYRRALRENFRATDPFLMDPCRLCERAFRNTDGFPRNSTADKKDRLISQLRERVNSLIAQVNDTRDNGFNVNHLIEFQASRLACHFSFCYMTHTAFDYNAFISCAVLNKNKQRSTYSKTNKNKQSSTYSKRAINKVLHTPSRRK